jgi:hypothetical protein
LIGERITASAGRASAILGRDRSADLRTVNATTGADDEDPDQHEELPGRVEVQAVEREVEGHQPREHDHDQQESPGRRTRTRCRSARS